MVPAQSRTTAWMGPKAVAVFSAKRYNLDSRSYEPNEKPEVHPEEARKQRFVNEVNVGTNWEEPSCDAKATRFGVLLLIRSKKRDNLR